MSLEGASALPYHVQHCNTLHPRFTPLIETTIVAPALHDTMISCCCPACLYLLPFPGHASPLPSMLACTAGKQRMEAAGLTLHSP